MNPSAAPLSESGDPKGPDRKTATLPESKSTPAAADKEKPVSSGGVPIVVDARTPKKTAHGAGAAFAEIRTTDLAPSKVEPVGAKSAPVAKTAAPADKSYAST